MFLAKSFTVLVESVKKTDVAVTERPFIPPVQQTTGTSGQMKKAIQPVEAHSASTATQPIKARSALTATQPVEAPGATTVVKPTSQDVTHQFAADRSEV